MLFRSETGYAFGLDRPELLLNANIEVTPISKLKLNLGYELRSNRSIWTKTYIQESLVVVEKWEKYKLADASNLYFSANYEINDMLGVFANLNNILNKKWETTQYYGAQKFNFMLGASVKF